MIRILSREDVQQALPMGQAIEAMKAAFAQLSTGRADVPLRAALPVPQHNGVTLPSSTTTRPRACHLSTRWSSSWTQRPGSQQP